MENINWLGEAINNPENFGMEDQKEHLEWLRPFINCEIVDEGTEEYKDLVYQFFHKPANFVANVMALDNTWPMRVWAMDGWVVVHWHDDGQSNRSIPFLFIRQIQQPLLWDDMSYWDWAESNIPIAEGVS